LPQVDALRALTLAGATSVHGLGLDLALQAAVLVALAAVAAALVGPPSGAGSRGAGPVPGGEREPRALATTASLASQSARPTPASAARASTSLGAILCR
jgi:hypothetical protein